MDEDETSSSGGSEEEGEEDNNADNENEAVMEMAIPDMDTSSDSDDDGNDTDEADLVFGGLEEEVPFQEMYYDAVHRRAHSRALAVVEGPERAPAQPEDFIDLNYDIGLPLEHSYLGGLNTLQGGRVLFAEGTKLKLPLVYLNGIILVPGQEIPFTFRHHSLITFFRRVINNESKTFGLGYNTNYGTTAEIQSCQFQANEVTIRAEGRQRFVIDSKMLEMGEIYSAFVTILPEVDLKSYFRPIRSAEQPNTRKPTKELIGLTPFPAFVHRQFDDYVLMKQLRIVMERIISPLARNQSLVYPIDPTSFSYFVLTCIPFSDQMKTKLLQFNCTTQRLRVEYALLSLKFLVQCAHCSCFLADSRDFLVMSKKGTGGTYVNPSGVVHELFTFLNLSNIAQVSDWSDEFSWFPNYGWIIIRCRRCMLHIGWKFTTKMKNIAPEKFFAVTRTAIKLSFHDIPQDSFAHKFVQDNNQVNIHWNTNWY